ncbi:MAG: WG repeat-containing protein [Oscillospiraceae bacterium]|nr:WG repeat-containing protein [Oscillospiraceae bacterium]
MKRALRISAAAAAISILLTGCGTQTQQPNGGGQTSGKTETTAPQQNQPPEDIQSGGKKNDTAESDPAEGNYEWRIKPFLEADDVNPLSIGSSGMDYGDIGITDYMLLTRGGKVGIITLDGNVVIEPESTRVYGYMQENGDLHIIFTDDNPDEGDRLCFCVTAGTLFRTAEDLCTLCGGRLTDSQKGKAAVWDAASGTLGMLPAADVWSAKENAKLKLDNSFTVNDLPDAAVARSVQMPENFRADSPTGTCTVSGGFGVVRGGREMSAMDYEMATDFKEGIAAFCKKGKWGYLNQAGRQVIPFEYDADYIYSYGEKGGKTVKLPYPVNEKYIALNKGDDAGFANARGKIVIPVGSFAAARPVIGGQAWVKDRRTGLWGVIAIGEAADGSEAVEPQQQEPVEAQEQEQKAVQLPPATGEGWQAAYAEVLRSDGTGENLQFSLCMVDGDEIPELVLHWYDRKGFEADNEDVEMYTYYDNRLIYLGNVACDGYCTCKYLPQKHLVLVGGMRDDVALYEFKVLENGELKTLCTFNMSVSGKTVKYRVDDKECSKDEYVAKWKEYYNGDVSYDGGMYRNNDENVVGLFGVEPLEQAG